MRIGGSVLNSFSNPEEWIGEVKRLNYSCVIFPLDSTASTKDIDEYVEVIKANNLIIGEVGIWRNLMSSDPDEQKKVLDYSIKQLELAEYVGANCAVNISGSLGSYWDGYDPANYSKRTKDLIISQSQTIIDAVKPVKTTYALEPMPWMLPDSPDSYLDLIKLVDRERFKVHLDFTNMINSIERYHNSTTFIDECFEKLSDQIVSVHIKDCLLKEGALPLVIEEKMVGDGALDLTRVLRHVEAISPNATAFVEHLDTDKQYADSIRYLRSISEEAGVNIL